jgi:hypothetical protein
MAQPSGKIVARPMVARACGCLQAIRALPPGTQIIITRGPDGAWIGTLTANGTKVEAAGDGPQSVSVSLARQWLAAHGSPKP